MNLVSDEDCLGLYIWNKKLGSTIFPVLQLLEVSLRNAVHQGFLDGQPQTSANGAGQTPTVTQLDRSWFRTFFEQSQATYTESWKQIVQAEQQLQRQQQVVDIDRLISKLPFGFWSNLCSRTHNESKVGSLQLWPKYQRHVFPGSYKNGNWIAMKEIQESLLQINNIRNRIAHHEPIWHSVKAYELENFVNKLVRDFRKCLDVVGWINPSNLKTVAIMESCTEFAHLCNLQTIETYKQLGRQFHQTSPIDPEQWERSCLVNDRHNGVVISQKNGKTVIKSLKDKLTFVFDDTIVKAPAYKPHETVNFKPARSINFRGQVTLLAQNVKIGHI
ncbi:hypothetical protein J2S30_002296 [Herbaspirillum rubrisubalbicans]|uniref:Abi family protein n=1 Tax=Herbaspirillum rubrisubalbicans TaxID=80842 RepID=UPI00209CA73B|nr:hypothetical protein [Herbaspirillum rubrisubalbicans]